MGHGAIWLAILCFTRLTRRSKYLGINVRAHKDSAGTAGLGVLRR